MITIDTSALTQSQYFDLTTKRKNHKAYSSIDKVTDDSTQNTTTNNTNTQNNVTNTTTQNNVTNTTTQNTNTSTDPTDDKVAKSCWDYSANDIQSITDNLQLDDPANKFTVLRKLSRENLIDLLPNLNQKKLSMGLKFIDEDVLRHQICTLPKEQLLKLLFRSVNNKQKLIDQFPTNGVRRFIDSPEIKKDDYMKMFQQMSPAMLAKITESITGTPTVNNKNQGALIKGLTQYSKSSLSEGIRALTGQEVKTAAKILTSQNSEQKNQDLFKEFSQTTLSKPLEYMSKFSMINNAQAIDPKYLINMLDAKLPNDYLALTLTTIDTDVLTKNLQSKNSDLLISIAQAGGI